MANSVDARQLLDQMPGLDSGRDLVRRNPSGENLASGHAAVLTRSDGRDPPINRSVV
jgi:hypothetical protein